MQLEVEAATTGCHLNSDTGHQDMDHAFDTLSTIAREYRVNVGDFNHSMLTNVEIIPMIPSTIQGQEWAMSLNHILDDVNGRLESWTKLKAAASDQGGYLPT